MPDEPRLPSEAGRPAPPSPNLTLPVALGLIGLCIWAGFQTVQLVRERSVLHGLRTNLEAPVQESVKVRAQLDSIAKKTAELAAQGNAGAKTIVEELRKRGITINPNPPAPAPAPPSK